MQQARFEIFRGHNSLFQFRLLDLNDKLLLSGGSYFYKPGCYVGIAALRTCSPAEFVRDDVAYRYSFSIENATGETFGQGPSYFTQAARDQAMQRVMQVMAHAPVVCLNRGKKKAAS